MFPLRPYLMEFYFWGGVSQDIRLLRNANQDVQQIILPIYLASLLIEKLTFAVFCPKGHLSSQAFRKPKRLLRRAHKIDCGQRSCTMGTNHSWMLGAEGRDTSLTMSGHQESLPVLSLLEWCCGCLQPFFHGCKKAGAAEDTELSCLFVGAGCEMGHWATAWRSVSSLWSSAGAERRGGTWSWG